MHGMAWHQTKAGTTMVGRQAPAGGSHSLPVLIKGVFGCNDRTGRDETILQIRLFGTESRVGTELS
jgi:hypothetical protein